VPQLRARPADLTKLARLTFVVDWACQQYVNPPRIRGAAAAIPDEWVWRLTHLPHEPHEQPRRRLRTVEAGEQRL
jgi:hypothetical protein